MSRVQLALNVTDLDQAVEFYAKLFAVEPANRRRSSSCSSRTPTRPGG
jgi:predicted enzyme related to lactoylglutathione lyase